MGQKETDLCGAGDRLLGTGVRAAWITVVEIHIPPVWGVPRRQEPDVTFMARHLLLHTHTYFMLQGTLLTPEFKTNSYFPTLSLEHEELMQYQSKYASLSILFRSQSHFKCKKGQPTHGQFKCFIFTYAQFYLIKY